jgi:hypothetical protein
MQEAQPIGLDPLSIDYQMPWASRLLILYLLVVVTVSLVNPQACCAPSGFPRMVLSYSRVLRTSSCLHGRGVQTKCSQ